MKAAVFDECATLQDFTFKSILQLPVKPLDAHCVRYMWLSLHPEWYSFEQNSLTSAVEQVSSKILHPSSLPQK